ncbi:9105_t:CDS:10 [Entrophospora sp. SA101]|nr:9105_t:CDS:10 [Entrophospora sp. SA101]
MAEVQKWLEDNYKNDTTEIRIGKGVELEGKLTIDGYPNLKNIYLGGAKGITELDIKNCPNVEVIFVSRNQITKIEGLANLPKLQSLSFGNNKIEKIDISQNKQLETIAFAKNPTNLDDDTFAIKTLLEQASGADLKEIAKELNLNVDETATPEDLKQIIKDEAAKIEQNKTKLNENLPGLLDKTAKVDDAKLEEIKNNVDKGEEYQKLVNEPTNAPIVDAGKIDQTKLTDELKKAANYEKLVENENNKELVTDDGKEIDQGKIDGLKTASGDAAAAIPILGVDNLKPDTLNTKLGGSKLSDIPTNLKDLLEKSKKMEDALNNAGINPNDPNMEKRLKELNLLEETVIEFFGEKYEEILKMPEYQNQKLKINMTKTAQSWLEAKYSNKTVGGKIELYDKNIEGVEELTGELLIENYVNVEEIKLERRDERKHVSFRDRLKGQITKITIKNCPKVKELNLNNNKISEIIFEGEFPDLVRLDLIDNKLSEIDISKIPKLIWLAITRNPIAKIKGLENSTQLRSLDELENRPTQVQLEEAVEAEAKKYEKHIAPDKLEEEAKNKGMVSKQEYDKAELDKIQAELDKIKNLLGSLDEIDRLKKRPTSDNSDQIKDVLGLNPTDDLPTDWQAQLVKKNADLEAAQKIEKEINDLKSKAADTTPNTEQQQKIDNLIKSIEKQNQAITNLGEMIEGMGEANINKYLSDNYNNSTAEINNSHKGNGDVLFGKAELKNYPNLKKIELEKNELEGLVIIDCPNLELIRVGDNKLTELDIEKIKTTNGVSLEHCPELQKFYAPKTDKLDKVPGLDRLKKINIISVSDGLLRLIVPEKLDYYKEVVKVVRETLGMGPEGDIAAILPTLKDKIEDKVINVQSPQLKTEKERDEAKAKLEDIQQQLAAIGNELGLTESVTKEQIIYKIKELMNRPTGPVCTHTNYDDIKSERDNLKTDNESKKRKIEELEGNKENGITKKVMMKRANELFNELSIHEDNRAEINSANSAEKVLEKKDEIIRNEFSRLKDENNSSFYLNIGLGALTIGVEMKNVPKKISIKSLISTRNFLAEIIQDAESDYEKAGAIQAFKVCYELARNTMRKVLNLRAVRVDDTPRAIFRLAGIEVKGTARKLSDLDICYQEDIPAAIAFQIEEEFKESDLPFLVELVS